MKIILSACVLILLGAIFLFIASFYDLNRSDLDHACTDQTSWMNEATPRGWIMATLPAQKGSR